MACGVIWLAAGLSGQEELRRADALAVVELQPRIDEAIDRGVAWLLGQQERDGSWSSGHQSYYGGQTALSAYTLAKAGMPASHPGVRRALAHLTTVEADKTYVAGTMLLALAESGDPVHARQIQKLVAKLVGWQRGSWPYPTIGPDTHHRDQDLSLTQFALLGLRAAAKVGANVPPRVWQDAAKTTLRYQERPEEATVGGAKVAIAGFRYRLESIGKATGSMTTAGLASLWIAREGLGSRVPAELGRDVATALELGRNWLAHHFDVRQNPNHPAWINYYLYGLERASTLLGIAYYGSHSWYLEGARALLETQQKDGAWGTPASEAETCFAVLFLKRATSVATGAPPKGARAYLADARSEDVAMRAKGGDRGEPLTLWLVRVGDPAGLRRYAVDEVIYRADDTVVATVAGDCSPWVEKATFHAEWQPPARGRYQVSATVRARRLDAEGKPVGDVTELRCKGFRVEVADVLQPWMLPAATWRARNLLAGVTATASASSQFNGARGPERAVDGVEGSAWTSAADDPAPRLVVELAEPVPARTVVLTQANGARAWMADCDLVRAVHLFVNGAREPIVVEMGEDGFAPVRVDLARTVRVRKLDLAVQSRWPGRRHAGSCGFGEIALEK